MLHLRLLQFWALNCTKMRLVARLHPDPLGELYSASTDPLAVMGEGREGQEAEREGEKGEGKGREGRERGRGRERKGHSNPLVTNQELLCSVAYLLCSAV